MEVLIPDSRGSQHLPIWAASACRTMPHPLRWQHNSSLMFWSHAFTSIQQCSINQIMCRCKDDKANPCHVMWLVKVLVFEDCPAFLFIILILLLNKKKASHVLDSSLSNGSIFDILELLTLIYYWFRRGFDPKSLQPEETLVSPVEPAWRASPV